MSDESVKNWQGFVSEKPPFASMLYRWMCLLRNLAISTPSNEDDLVGHLIMTGIVMSLADVDDILTLSHKDSHSGAQKILRGFYERVVTLKYIASNPSEAARFMDFESIDTSKVIAEIHALTGLEMNPASKANLEAAVQTARTRYKQKRCETCKQEGPMSWTTLNSKDMAERVGLGHLYLHAFLITSKLIHPTYWSVRDISSGSPVYNTLNATHELLVHLLLIHRRHFAPHCGVTPMMNTAINDFLSTWTISISSFDGLLTKSAPESRDRVAFYG
jgi:hypothetical protein